MDLKNAVAVCLISFFSATLVVLIARALDLQAASRLEPQLAAIVEELQALRRQGGGIAAPDDSLRSEALDDGLVVYYFHSNTRCPTCQAIESQAHETVQAHFGSRLERGEIVWKTLNYEEPAGAPLATQFEVQMPVVVLARMKGGEIEDWKRLDDVWGLVGDRPAFTAYVRDAIRQMLAGGESSSETPDRAADAPPPLPAPAELPVPATPSEIPVPE